MTDTTRDHLISTAKRCARKHAERNVSDPFSAPRAYSRVIEGLLFEQDFENPIGDV